MGLTSETAFEKRNTSATCILYIQIQRQRPVDNTIGFEVNKGAWLRFWQDIFKVLYFFIHFYLVKIPYEEIYNGKQYHYVNGNSQVSSKIKRSQFVVIQSSHSVFIC